GDLEQPSAGRSRPKALTLIENLAGDLGPDACIGGSQSLPVLPVLGRKIRILDDKTVCDVGISEPTTLPASLGFGRDPRPAVYTDACAGQWDEGVKTRPAGSNPAQPFLT